MKPGIERNRYFSGVLFSMELSSCYYAVASERRGAIF
jgi:hypothetical protein